MHITDPVADMLTRIRNANNAKHEISCLALLALRIRVSISATGSVMCILVVPPILELQADAC